MSTKQAIRAVVTRRFHATAEQVFDAWLNREMIGKWLVGPAVREEEIIHLSLTPRVGGAFSFLVERNGEEIEHVGKYFEIHRPARLVFTWVVTNESLGSRIIVDIAKGKTGCELTLTQELHPSWAEKVGHTEEGWSKLFDALERELARSS